MGLGTSPSTGTGRDPLEGEVEAFDAFVKNVHS